MLNRFFKSKYALVIMQFISLTVFILLIMGGIGVATDDEMFAKVLRNTNLANLIVWSYWWPLIVITAILFGRFWCSICPMEMINSFFAKIGLKRKPNKWLKSGWSITLFYAVILIIGMQTLEMHRVPQMMAMYMLMLLGIASIVGLIWEKRTFCTYVCPVGNVLGLYSLLSSKKLRVTDKDICKSCKTKDCVHKNNDYKFIGRSCTSGLYPANITDNKDCILCGQCLKSCTKDNISVQKQRFSVRQYINIELSWSQIVFFFLLSAFINYEIMSEWNVSKNILMAVPKYLLGVFGITGRLQGTIKAVTLFIVFPAIFYTIFGLIKRFVFKEDWKTLCTNIVLAVLPLTASMHLFKALLKTTSRIPYWEFALHDWTGVDSANKILANPDILTSYFASFIEPTLSIIGIVLITAGSYLSFITIKNQAENIFSRAVSYMLVFVYVFMFVVTIFGSRIFKKKKDIGLISPMSFKFF